MISALVMILTVGKQTDPLSIQIPKLEITAQSVQHIANQIGEAAGVKLLVPGKLGSEIVFASLKDKTAKQCMDYLANVSYGEWKFDNGVYRLVRNQSAQAAEAKAQSTEVELLRKQLKEKAAELKQPAWSRDAAKKYVDGLYAMQKSLLNNFRVGEGERAQVTIEGPSVAGPAYDLLSTVIQNVDPVELMSIPKGGRVVYSTSPNRMQKPLRMNLGTAIQQFTLRMNDVYEASQTNSYPDLGADFNGSVGFPKARTGAVAKANITVFNGQGGYTIGIQLVGINGEEIAQTSSNHNPGTEFDPNEPTPPRNPEPVADPIKLSAISSEFLSYVSIFGLSGGSSRSIGVFMDGAPVFVSAGQAARNISPSIELNKILLTPAQHDPLNLVIPESLDAVYADKQFVAIIPDALWEQLSPMQVAQLSQKRVNDTLASVCEVTAENGVTTIRPLRPFLSESSRLNRGAMERLVSQVNSRGFAHLSELAEYATARKDMSFGQSLDMLILGISVPFAAQDIRGGFGFNYWMAPIIASQKVSVDSLPDGDFYITYGRMNAGEKQALERLIFDEPLSAQIASGNMSISVNTEPNTNVPMARDSEPTERFPNGLPVDVGLKLTAKSQEGVLGKLSKSRNGRLMSATQLGAILGMIDGEGGSDGEMKITAYEIYQLATVKEIQASVERGQNGGSVRGGQQFTDGELKPGSPLTLNQLPSDMIGRIQSARKQLRDMMERMNSGGGRNTVPPPAN